jgi:hypothetical protein
MTTTWTTDAETKNSKGEVKTASFTAARLAVIECPSLTPSTGSVTFRPVWAVVAGTEMAMKYFIANIRLGKKIEPDRTEIRSERIEFLKTWGYRLDIQRPADGIVSANVYIRDVCTMDTGMVDPWGVRFLLVVPEEWHLQILEKVSPKDIDDAIGHVRSQGLNKNLTPEVLRSMIPTAILFSGYLDRRTRCPLIPTLKFQLQILCAALDNGLARFPDEGYRSHYREWGFSSSYISKFQQQGLVEWGCHEISLKKDSRTPACIGFRAEHKDVEEFLAKEVGVYLK